MHVLVEISIYVACYSSCMCVCVCVLVIPRDSCSHFLHDRWKLRPETCNASLSQYYLKMKLVDFAWLVALLSSYGMICLSWQQLPAIQRTNFQQLAAYQHDSSICTTNQNAIGVKSRERDCQSKFCLLSTDHVQQLKAWPNLAPTPADYIVLLLFLCVRKQLPGCTVANT